VSPFPRGLSLCGEIFAWEDCPFGEKDCPYPGLCGRYVDTDNDSICDHSQPAPENRANISNVIETSAKANREVKAPISKNAIPPKRIYHLIPISIVLIFLYLLTFIFSKKRIITKTTHIKIWNILLLITFLISGVLGILLIIGINFGFTLSSKILFWHVEFGIAMAVIGIFHIIWHWKYFKSILKSNNT
jgi:hypothetical protein